ncbi:MAG: hypothetical protein HQ541_00815 [Mariniphaga sp.]|nr:hypothetical protein [Mariniphaga sp.]
MGKRLKRNKVFIGPFNTAGFSGTLTKALKSVGVNADFVSWKNSDHPFNYGVDKEMWLFDHNPSFKIMGKNQNYWFNQVLIVAQFIKMTFIYNTFIFIKPVTFFRNNKDLYFLRLFRKKIIFIFAGCNDRNPDFIPEDQEYICHNCCDKVKQVDNWCDRLDEKKKRVQWFEKFANKILAFDDNASYLKDKGKQLWISAAVAPPPENNYMDKYKQDKIVICHLPSNPLIKQTHIIEPILRRIEKEENVEIIIKKNIWSRKKMMDTLERSHINIDALGGMIFGTIVLEGLCRGTVGLASYPDWISKHYNVDPVVGITKDNLYEILKELIRKRALLERYARRSLKAYNKYFTYEAVGTYYKEKLELK